MKATILDTHSISSDEALRMTLKKIYFCFWRNFEILEIELMCTFFASVISLSFTQTHTHSQNKHTLSSSSCLTRAQKMGTKVSFILLAHLFSKSRAGCVCVCVCVWVRVSIVYIPRFCHFSSVPLLQCCIHYWDLYFLSEPLFSAPSRVNQMLLTSSFTSPLPPPFKVLNFCHSIDLRGKIFFWRKNLFIFLPNIINLFFLLVIESKFAPPLPRWKKLHASHCWKKSLRCRPCSNPHFNSFFADAHNFIVWGSRPS